MARLLKGREGRGWKVEGRGGKEREGKGRGRKRRGGGGWEAEEREGKGGEVAPPFFRRKLRQLRLAALFTPGSFTY